MKAICKSFHNFVKSVQIQVIGWSAQQLVAMANNMNISQPQIRVFKGENFGFWSIKMKTLFLLKDLWDFVENRYT